MYTYCPPVSGIIAPISAVDIALNNVTRPAITHTNNINAGEPTSAAISAGRIKIPEPITPPTTNEAAVDKLIVLFSEEEDDIKRKISGVYVLNK